MINFKDYCIERFKLIEDNLVPSKMDEIQLYGMVCTRYPNAVKETLKLLRIKMEIGEILYLKVLRLCEIGDYTNND